MDRAEARELLDQLVAMPTFKGNGQVPVLAAELSRRLREAGFAEDQIQLLAMDANGNATAALVVRYAGRSGSDRAPIALLGHMDVVEAIADNWASDPFTATEKDGYLYGRGVVDNKAQVSLLVTTLMRLKRAGWVPDRDLVLALSGDEESGSHTTRLLTRHPWLQGAEFALNADAGPDGRTFAFFIQAAEKTSVSFTLATSNSGGHSSMPRPDHAIHQMAGALSALQTLRFPVQFNDINRAMVHELVATRDVELATALQSLLKDPADPAARLQVERYPQDAHILWTTCTPTMIHGGNARNALPQNVDVTVHCRIFPGVPVEQVHAQLIAAINDPGVVVTIDAARASSPPSPIHPALFAAVRRAVHANYPGASVVPEMSSGGTDGRYFRQVGIPTYGVGSLAQLHPDDDRMHGIDERLRLTSFDRELVFWDVLLKELAGASGLRGN